MKHYAEHATLCHMYGRWNDANYNEPDGIKIIGIFIGGENQMRLFVVCAWAIKAFI